MGLPGSDSAMRRSDVLSTSQQPYSSLASAARHQYCLLMQGECATNPAQRVCTAPEIWTEG